MYFWWTFSIDVGKTVLLNTWSGPEKSMMKKYDNLCD